MVGFVGVVFFLSAKQGVTAFADIKHVHNTLCKEILRKMILSRILIKVLILSAFWHSCIMTFYTVNVNLTGSEDCLTNGLPTSQLLHNFK